MKFFIKLCIVLGLTILKGEGKSQFSYQRCTRNGVQVPCDSSFGSDFGQSQSSSSSQFYQYEKSSFSDSGEMWDDEPSFMDGPSSKPFRTFSSRFRESTGSGESTTCFLNGRQVSCNDPMYIRVDKAGGHLSYGTRMSNSNRQCIMNGRPVSCDDELFNEMTDNSNNAPSYPSPMPQPEPRTTTRAPPTFKCGQRKKKLSPMIAGGENVASGEFPWHVAIYRKNDPVPLKCSGSIITEYAVVTAAHCFYNESETKFNSASEYIIGVAKITRDYYTKDDPDVTKYYKIEKIFTDGYYGANTNYQNDIAVLQVARSIRFNYKVGKVCLYTRDKTLRPGIPLSVAGWGKYNLKDDTYSPTLQTADFNYVTNSECLSNLGNDEKSALSADKFCVYHANGTALMLGDSGGGLAVREASDSSYYLVGIVSVRADNVGNKLSLITKLSHFRDWIRERVKEIHLTKDQ